MITRWPVTVTLMILLCFSTGSCRIQQDCRDMDVSCKPAGFLLYSRVAVPKFALIANVLNASISIYSINKTTGALSQVVGSPFATGTNPKFVTQTPDGSFVYEVNQVTPSIYGYSINASSGFLTSVPGSPFPAAVSLYTAVVTPSGRFLYAGSEVAGNIYGYSIDRFTGTLTAISGSPFSATASPGALTTDPTGKFLFGVSADPLGKTVYAVNYFTTDVYTFSLNSATGFLTQLGSPVTVGATPTFVYVEPMGRFLYVANNGDATGNVAISGFSLNLSTGALTAISGSPFASCANPAGISADPSGLFLYVSGGTAVCAQNINQTTGALTAMAGSPYPGLQSSAMSVLSKYEY